ncbi:hypothetical protein QYE76_028620 [Lolium multiflorum]|jgi:hypothetical protein|uniref:Uncharacterized protein n=1 Tax=Lolium multiflorum TaxID=4521 RepID=A0AAD8QP02_LOLMU|nr:hypothetical protein QYE76_028620 [Lolium multiflorum]
MVGTWEAPEPAKLPIPSRVAYPILCSVLLKYAEENDKNGSLVVVVVVVVGTEMDGDGDVYSVSEETPLACCLPAFEARRRKHQHQNHSKSTMADDALPVAARPPAI